jgi:hypothetical protein
VAVTLFYVVTIGLLVVGVVLLLRGGISRVIGGSLIVTVISLFAWVFLRLGCAVFENEEESFYEHCDEGIPEIALAAIPIGILGLWLTRRHESKWRALLIAPVVVVWWAAFALL